MNEGDDDGGGCQKDSLPELELVASYLGLCAKGLSMWLLFEFFIVAGSISS